MCQPKATCFCAQILDQSMPPLARASYAAQRGRSGSCCALQCRTLTAHTAASCRVEGDYIFFKTQIKTLTCNIVHVLATQAGHA